VVERECEVATRSVGMREVSSCEPLNRELTSILTVDTTTTITSATAAYPSRTTTALTFVRSRVVDT